MRRLVFAVGVTFGFMLATPSWVAADVNLSQTNQAILSCSDGHSLILLVDSATLTSLAADVASINTSGTGLSCTLDTATVDPSTQTNDWTVFDYNPSGQALAPRHSPDSMPATTPDHGMTWQFQFKPNVYTALFTTTDPSVTGDESTKTLTDEIAVSGDAASFMTQHGGGDCVGNTPAAVRFYFTSPSASGPSTGTPPAGFYTHFWWSNPMNFQLVSGNASGPITAHMANPREWSDWNGQNGASSPSVTEAFVEATHHVQSIGLSFGGECFFETGVTPTPNTFTMEQFSSQFSTT